MRDLIAAPNPQEWTDGDVLMSAVELFASELFSVADNDSMYHHKINQVRQALLNGYNSCSCEDVAECILAWWGEL